MNDLRDPWGDDPAAELRGSTMIGVDVGQRSDYTAFCVVQSQGQSRLPFNPLPLWRFEVRALDRLPLGIPYPEMALRLRDIVHNVVNRTSGVVPLLFIDATGVGTALVDELRAVQVEAVIEPVFFTYGDKRIYRVHKATQQRYLSLGKAWLVSRLQILFGGNRLAIPPTPLATVVRKELLDYEIKIDPDGDDKYGAFRVGSHDDLVTALGLAVQLDAGSGGHWTSDSYKTADVLPARF